MSEKSDKDYNTLSNFQKRLQEAAGALSELFSLLRPHFERTESGIHGSFAKVDFAVEIGGEVVDRTDFYLKASTLFSVQQEDGTFREDHKEQQDRISLFGSNDVGLHLFMENDQVIGAWLGDLSWDEDRQSLVLPIPESGQQHMDLYPKTLTQRQMLAVNARANKSKFEAIEKQRSNQKE